MNRRDIPDSNILVTGPVSSALLPGQVSHSGTWERPTLRSLSRLYRALLAYPTSHSISRLYDTRHLTASPPAAYVGATQLIQQNDTVR